MQTADFTDANLTNLVSRSVTGQLAQVVPNHPLALVAPVFTGANVDGADFSSITRLPSDPTITSGGITGTPATLPTGSEGMRLIGGYLVTNHADLDSADLSGADLSGLDLGGSGMSGTNLSGADLTGVHACNLTGTPTALPTGWAVLAGCLIGPGANLDGEDLSGADLTGANLTGTDLTGTDLTGTNLTGTDLTGTNLTGTDLTGTNLAGPISPAPPSPA